MPMYHVPGLGSRVLPYYCESQSVVNYGNNTRIYNKYLLNRYFIGFTAIYCPNNSRLPSPAMYPCTMYHTEDVRRASAKSALLVCDKTSTCSALFVAVCSWSSLLPWPQSSENPSAAQQQQQAAAALSLFLTVYVLHVAILTSRHHRLLTKSLP